MPTDDTAKRFVMIYAALRSYIATHSTVSYPHDLRPNQIKMLHLVLHQPGISQATAAEQLGITPASFSNSVRVMETQGLIERRPNPDDARVLLLYLTPAGRQIFEQVFNSFVSTCADLLSVLPDNERRHLVELLEWVLTANEIDPTNLRYSEKLRTLEPA